MTDQVCLAGSVANGTIRKAPGLAGMSSTRFGCVSRYQVLPSRGTFRIDEPNATSGIFCGSQHCGRVVSQKSQGLSSIPRYLARFAYRGRIRPSICTGGRPSTGHRVGQARWSTKPRAVSYVAALQIAICL